ncbi:MAG: NAD(P)H-hydrate epimerase [Nitrososphaerota archaeon]
MQVITPDQMRAVEERCERLGVSRLLLMENAGTAVARHVKKKFGPLKGIRIVVVAGTGNNGGDGFVAARHLAGFGGEITIILLGNGRDIKTSEARTNWQIVRSMAHSIKIYEASDEEAVKSLKDIFMSADIIIDAIFGTGVKGAVKEPHSSAIDLINESKAYKIAVDVPSGLDPLTGEVHDKAVRANVTISFHRAKVGLLKKRGLTGKIIVAPIGVPPEAETKDPFTHS